LRDGGYIGGGFTANIRLGRKYGYGQGFATWTPFWGKRGSSEVKTRAAVLRRSSLDWLRQTMGRAPQQPILLYFQFMEPHTPYKPPEAYRARAGLPPAATETETALNATVTGTGGDHEPLTPQAVQLLKALYDGEVASIDAEIGALLDDLQKVGFLDNAVVVITADHGEEFGEHGVFLHGKTLYNPSIRIPLIVVGPEIAAGRVVRENVSLLDVAPTLLDLASMPEAPTFDGRSLYQRMHAPSWRERLRAYLSGSSSTLPPGPVTGEVVSELESFGENAVRLHARTLVSGTEKLFLLPNGNRLLYDLANDPGETAPLRGAPIFYRGAELLARLQEITAAPPAQSTAEHPLDEATKERLRALGYNP
jgi:arylsulfatase A-like enzyme